MFQDMVTGLLVSDGTVQVKTALGLTFEAVLCLRYFHEWFNSCWRSNFGGGRAGERASKGITEELIALGFEAGRMKTRTPPRIDGRTIDFKTMEEQKGDENPGQFSFMGDQHLKINGVGQHTHKVHDTLKKGLTGSAI